MSNKINDEKYAMIMTIADWMSKGISKKTLHILIEEKFGLKSYSARNKYINEAAKEIVRELDINSLKELLIARLDSISEKAENESAYNPAIKAIEVQAKLLGLTESKSVEIEDGEKVFKIKFGE